MGRRSERAVALFFAIFGVTLVAYWPALHGGPLWDDFGHITVPELRSLWGLWRIWSELGATQQVLSAAAFGVLARAPAMGRRVPRLPSGERRAALRCGLPSRSHPQTPRGAWGAVRGPDLRAASRLRRIGGLDIRAEEHAVGGVLSGVGSTCICAASRGASSPVPPM